LRFIEILPIDCIYRLKLLYAVKIAASLNITLCSATTSSNIKFLHCTGGRFSRKCNND